MHGARGQSLRRAGYGEAGRLAAKAPNSKPQASKGQKSEGRDQGHRLLFWGTEEDADVEVGDGFAGDVADAGAGLPPAVGVVILDGRGNDADGDDVAHGLLIKQS